jgi:hypothetical protein
MNGIAMVNPTASGGDSPFLGLCTRGGASSVWITTH